MDLVNGHGANCFGPGYNAWLDERFPDFRERKSKCRNYPDGIDQGNVKTHHWDLPPEAHSSCYIADRTVEYLQQTSDQPFFLHVSFPDPHHPFTVPEPYAGMYRPEDMPEPLPAITECDGAIPVIKQTYRNREGFAVDRVTGTPPVRYPEVDVDDWKQVKALYYGMTTLMDEQIGRILDTLEQTGLAENTVVAFLSDHGDYLGDYGLVGKGFHFDSIIRTPLMMKGPGIQTAQVADGMASVVDIGPTLLDLADIDCHESVQGVSMKDTLITGDALPRIAVLTENDDDLGAIRFRTLTTRDWKVTIYANQACGELYDRKNDPNELHNLWDSPEYAIKKQEMKNPLLEELLCSFDTMNGRIQNPKPDLVRWRAKHLPENQYGEQSI